MNNVSSYMQELMDTILEVRYTDLVIELDCCQKLIKEAEYHGSTFAIAFAYTYLGDYYLAQYDAINCGPYLMKAKELCLLNSFKELYMHVCHFTGIYYNMLYDEQNSLQYYIDALELAQTFENARLECLILNNIGDIFQCRDDLEEANRYYLQALNKLHIANYPQNSRHKILILSGLSEISILSGKLAEAKQYLQQCELIQPDSESDRDYQFFMTYKNWCLYAALNNDRLEAITYAERLLIECLSFNDKYGVMSTMLSVCDIMINLGEQVLSQRYISELSKRCSLHELYSIQRLMDLKIHYHETFSNEEETNRVYREFYRTLREASTIENQVRTNGMKAKIHLRELIKEQEHILKKNKQLETEAHIDELTGIYNRRYMNKLLSKLGAEPSTKRAGIIMLDIDYFKEYNDTYGHIQGDQVLILIAVALRKYSSELIFPGRYGGDEFICFCTNCQDSEIEDYINNICADIYIQAIPHKKSRCEKIITLSIGYSNCIIDSSLNTNVIAEQADQALYNSKNRGRNRWTKYIECPITVP